MTVRDPAAAAGATVGDLTEAELLEVVLTGLAPAVRDGHWPVGTVAPGDEISVEKLEGKAGDNIVIDNVLMLGGDKGVTVGAPLPALGVTATFFAGALTVLALLAIVIVGAQ